MPRQLGLPAALARYGLKVELSPGWETRGGATFAPRGAVSHWTAGPKGSTTRPSLNICINGRAGLPGPLCNVYLDRNGVAVVVASGTANHAGVGGWKGLTGNSQVFGTEAECGGDGDWTAAQRAAYPRVNAAYCWLTGFGADMVCGHSEWAPTRKIDIRDWPMSAMRTQVAALLAGGTTTGGAEMDVNERALLENARADANNAARIASEVKNWIVDPNHGLLKQLGDIRAALIGGNPDGSNNFHWLRDEIQAELVETMPAAAAGVNVDALASAVADRIAARMQS